MIESTSFVQPNKLQLCFGIKDRTALLNQQLTVLNKYEEPAKTWYKIVLTQGLYNVHCQNCPTGETTHKYKFRQCNGCYSIRADSQGKIKTFSRKLKFAGKIINVKQTLAKKTVELIDIDSMERFVKTNRGNFSPLGCQLLDACKHYLNYYRQAQKRLDSQDVTTVDGHDQFLNKFVEMYTGEGGKQFKDGLLHGLISVFFSKY